MTTSSPWRGKYALDAPQLCRAGVLRRLRRLAPRIPGMRRRENVNQSCAVLLAPPWTGVPMKMLVWMPALSAQLPLRPARESEREVGMGKISIGGNRTIGEIGGRCVVK